MPNSFLTHKMIAREAALMLAEEMAFISNINRNREDDFSQKINGYRIGSEVKIKVPHVSRVFDGATFAGGASAPDQAETYVSLKVATQKHVPIAFAAVEKALEIAEYKERILRPAISTLCSNVQSDMLAKIYCQIPNLVGTPGAVPTTAKVYSQARGVLQAHLAADSPRTALISSDANIELTDASKALFNPNKAISDMFMRGYISDYAGFSFYECQNLPLHTNGAKVAGVLVNGASQSGATLNIRGLTAGDILRKGTVFTIAGVSDVHPLTGVSTGKPRQFVVLSDFTAAAATGAISIFPPINALPGGATVTAAPADGAAITIVGAANGSYRQNLLWHRDAIATAFCPLPVLAGCEGYTFDASGISLRVMTGGDVRADAEYTRIDVLYADPVAVRPDHACRVTE